MPHIMLKRTFKVKPTGFQNKAEKTFTLHGDSIDSTLVDALNRSLASVNHHAEAKRISFVAARTNGKHYTAVLNSDYQKYHEEDAVCKIMDVMESLGWDCKFQYNQEVHTEKVAAGTMRTNREVFLFSKKSRSSDGSNRSLGSSSRQRRHTNHS